MNVIGLLQEHPWYALAVFASAMLSVFGIVSWLIEEE